MSVKTDYAEPITAKSLAKRSPMAAEGKPQDVTSEMLNMPLAGLREVQVEQDKQRLRVSASVSEKDILKRRQGGKTEAVQLDPKDFKGAAVNLEIEGFRPPGLPTHFHPKKGEEPRRAPRRIGDDVGGTIFDADNRVLFNDPSYPWRITGKVRTAGGWGSGTVIGPRHVLTAGHVINWTGGEGGGIAWLTFTPAYFDGAGPWGEIPVSKVIFWMKADSPLSDNETAFDHVVLVTEQRIGDSIGYAGFRSYDSAWNGGAYWQYIGYPQELSSGERPAFQPSGVVTSVKEESFSGQTGLVMGHFNDFTPGQSGGCLWGYFGEEPWPTVVGVGSTIGSTAVERPDGTTERDNEFSGGPSMAVLIDWARRNHS